MTKKEKTTLTADDLALRQRDVAAAPLINTDFLELLHGREPVDPVHGYEGAALDLDTAIQRTKTGQWEVCIRLGAKWYRALTVALGEPVMETHRGRLTVIGPSPAQSEKQQQREADERERIEASEAYARSRREANQLNIDRAQRRQREALEKRNREMGYG